MTWCRPGYNLLGIRGKRQRVVVRLVPEKDRVFVTFKMNVLS